MYSDDTKIYLLLKLIASCNESVGVVLHFKGPADQVVV